MKILIAPDKFKGSLSAREVAENIAKGLRDVLADAKIDIVPMADGGEGTAEVICDALGGSWLKCQAHDPLGREIDCRYAYIDKQQLAVMEMSEAAGMRRLQRDEYDVDLASTFGVGEMLIDAAGRGAKKIVVGLGGSATNDGGFGMARALGFRFLTSVSVMNYVIARLQGRWRQIEAKTELKGRVSELQSLERITRPPKLVLPKVVAAADVRNWLLGQKGATYTFAPQKGATPDQLDSLDRALCRLADVLDQQQWSDFRNEPGAGAAGGLGFGLMSFCGAKIRPGFEVVADAVDLESKMKNVDLVITGEGSLDRQTLEGKTPAGVARLARKLGKRVFAIVGRASEDLQVRGIFDDVLELGGTIPQAKELLRERARQICSSF